MCEAMTESKETVIRIPAGARPSNRLDWAESSCLRWLSVALWTWMNPVLTMGNKRVLTDDDLFEVSAADDCRQLLDRLESVWERNEGRGTWRVLIKTFMRTFVLHDLLLLLYAAVRLAQPLLLWQLVVTLNEPHAPVRNAYLYACGIGLVGVAQSVLNQQYYFRGTRLGVQVRTALTTLIYKRLSFLPASALSGTTTGRLLNLISNDLSKFDAFGWLVHLLWVGPVEAIVTFAILWTQLGVGTLFGYGVLLVLFAPVQLFFGKKFGDLRANTVHWSDKRVKMINEILVGCQVVKMRRWEEAFEREVCDARTRECHSIARSNRLRAVNMAISFSLLPIMSLATFGGCWLMGQVLSPATIFTTLALFGNIRYSVVSALPQAIETLSDIRITVERIDAFMALCTQHRACEGEPSGTAGSIAMANASFTWDSAASATLTAMNLNVGQGALVGIIGATGAGKSSVLGAILGEMSLLEGTRGVHGRLAYVPQAPWIFAGSIRENIVFHKSFEKERYARVLRAAQLNADLHSLTDGDRTLIGEKGANLSGGQKARVALARALYADADIYLFDDPLAAVDPSVARQIFQHCLSNEGLLKGKTRVLVTHQVQFLREFDHCVVLEHGRIERQGPPSDLLAIEHILKLFEKQQHQTADQHIGRTDDASTDRPAPNKPPAELTSSVMKDEVSLSGTVGVHVWLKLFTAAWGYCGLAVLIVLMVLGEGAYDVSNKWLSIWSSKAAAEQRDTKDAIVYVCLVMGTAVLALIRAAFYFFLILRGASAMHNGMFRGVLYSPLRFYESNPVGRVLNRFSKDQQAVDDLLPTTLFEMIQTLILTVGVIVIVGMTNPWALLILVPIVPAFVWLRRYYLRTSRSLTRLESVTRSPVYALFTSSLHGLMTIRAFKMQNELLDLFVDKVNGNTRAHFLFTCTGRWFGLRLDLMTGCLTFVTAILSVPLRAQMDASSVALALSYCVGLTGLFQLAVRQSAEVENYMISAERIDEYASLPVEAEFDEAKSTPPADWPREGSIEFENYKLRYRPELEPVLKGMNLHIPPRSKVGIIGRTGAGKSSIFQALFRLTDPSTTEGKILIDGIDIHTLSLNDVRSALNIIPQSPVLFSNSLRYNLDPFHEHTDEQLWDVLHAVQLKDKIEKVDAKLNVEIAEYGSNFSVGECQLMCVARAMLKPSKILLVDEATAHVDTKTDGIIQDVLRDRFGDQTIVTIAHRLNTITDSDQLVVMSDGLVVDYGPPKDMLVRKDESIWL